MDFEKFTRSVQRRLSEAEALAFSAKNPTLASAHLLSAMLTSPESVAPGLVKAAGGNPEVLARAVFEELAKFPRIEGGSVNVRIDADLQQVIASASALAAKMGDEYVTEEHFLIALADCATLRPIFSRQAVGRESLESALKDLRKGERVTSPDAEALQGSLSKYATDLVELARKGKIDPVIGREDEIRRTIQILSRRTKNNPVLIGDPGVGKTAIVEGIARKIVDGDVPDSLKNKRLLSLDL